MSDTILSHDEAMAGMVRTLDRAHRLTIKQVKELQTLVSGLSEVVCQALGNGEIYSTPLWDRLRYEVLERDGRQCAACKSTDVDGVGIHVDHIHPVSKRPDLAFNIDNLQVLCGQCNRGKSNRFETDWRET